MKKIALALSTSLFLTNFVVASGAEESPCKTLPLYVDYVSGEMPANMFTVDQTAARSFNKAIRNSGNVDSTSNEYLADWSGEGKTWNLRKVWTTTEIGVSSAHGFTGLSYKNKNTDGSIIEAGRPVYDSEKSYVFKINEIRREINEFEYKDGVTFKPVKSDIYVGVALTNENAASVSYSKEYGQSGMLLTDEYQKLKGTIKPNSSFDSEKTNSFVVGVREGTAANAAFEIGLNTADAIYVAEEVAYSIKNTKVSGPEKLSQGTSAVFEAEVLNQLGLTGYLEQEFSWYALNSDRTEVVDDLIITPSEDTDKAVVTVSENAENGEYVIVAVSDKYGIAMGNNVSVKKAYYNDYIPGDMPENIMPVDKNSSPARTFANTNSHNGVDLKVGTTWNQAAACFTPKIMKPRADVGENTGAGFVGMVYTGYTFDNTKNYVFSVNARKTAGDDVKIGVSLSNENQASRAYSKEYGSEGMELLEEYRKFAVTIKPSQNFVNTKTNALAIGFPAGVKADAVVEFDTSTSDAVYLGIEQCYDISVERTTEEKELIPGESAEFSAKVLNQVGNTGYLSQNFTWYAMNTARNEFVDGISITESANTAKIILSEDLEPGEYDIVAVSDDYSIAKGCRIKVCESTEERIEKLTLNQQGSSIIMNVDVKNVEDDNAIFALGEFSGGKLVSVKAENVDILNGAAKKSVTINNVTDGNVVKAFIWTGGLKPIANISGYKTQLVASSLNELYGAELNKEDYQDMKVTEFYNNKAAAVSVTFDDGIYSAAEYYDSLLEEYNIHATAMMVSDWVKETEIPKWQALFDNGNIDLGNHSKSHSIKYKSDNPTVAQLEEDITGGYTALKEIFPNERILTFAAPWTQKTDASTAEIKKHHFANRGGGSGFVSSNPTEDVLMNLPGYVVENTNTAELLNSKIDTAIANKQWFIHLMHGVGEGTYNIPKDVCKEHFQYIGSKSDDVWAGSLTEVVQYIYEKKNATLEVNWLRENAANISVGDTLDDELFDFPLTVKVNVPSGWEKVKVSQNGVENTVNVCVEDSKSFVYINVIPDKGEVLLESI